ncbi:MAG TPA: response regulator [Lacunisphaera sp.]
MDDDSSVREMLARVIESDGHLAWPAANGNEAQAIAAAIPIDLVLMDLGLPGEDGWETLDTLLRQNPRLIVIVITARTNQRARAESAGAAALFEKPLDFTVLLKRVRKLLSEPPERRRSLVTGANLAARDTSSSRMILKRAEHFFP